MEYEAPDLIYESGSDSEFESGYAIDATSRNRRPAQRITQRLIQDGRWEGAPTPGDGDFHLLDLLAGLDGAPWASDPSAMGLLHFLGSALDPPMRMMAPATYSRPAPSDRHFPTAADPRRHAAGAAEGIPASPMSTPEGTTSSAPPTTQGQLHPVLHGMLHAVQNITAPALPPGGSGPARGAQAAPAHGGEPSQAAPHSSWSPPGSPAVAPVAGRRMQLAGGGLPPQPARAGSVVSMPWREAAPRLGASAHGWVGDGFGLDPSNSEGTWETLSEAGAAAWDGALAAGSAGAGSEPDAWDSDALPPLHSLAESSDENDGSNSPRGGSDPGGSASRAARGAAASGSGNDSGGIPPLLDDDSDSDGQSDGGVRGTGRWEGGAFAPDRLPGIISEGSASGSRRPLAPAARRTGLVGVLGQVQGQPVMQYALPGHQPAPAPAPAAASHGARANPLLRSRQLEVMHALAELLPVSNAASDWAAAAAAAREGPAQLLQYLIQEGWDVVPDEMEEAGFE